MDVLLVARNLDHMTAVAGWPPSSAALYRLLATYGVATPRPSRRWSRPRLLQTISLLAGQPRPDVVGVAGARLCWWRDQHYVTAQRVSSEGASSGDGASNGDVEDNGAGYSSPDMDKSDVSALTTSSSCPLAAAALASRHPVMVVARYPARKVTVIRG